jgi:PAS domain S-box-containing protein
VNDILKILLVDDNPDDRALVSRELSREFHACQFRTVIDGKDFAMALESGPWGMVITDYQLRWSDGITVLLAAKVRWPECPVIMFTGSGNEEIAVQAMKAGLDDYVLKSPRHYARLPAAVHMALERARQRRALREAEARYHILFEDVPVGLYRIGRDGQIQDANPAMIEMLGYSDRHSLLAVNARHLLVDARERRTWMNQMRRSGVVKRFDMQLHRADGAVIWVENNARAVKDARGKILRYEGSVEDITERKRAEKQLRDSREQLRALAAYLQSVREEERTRIAREVHDELGQALTGLKMDLAWIDKKLAEGTGSQLPGELQEKMKTLPGFVDTIIGTVRRIATELRPPVLDDLGLEAAIEWQIQEFEQRTGIKCRFHGGARHLHLDQERATAMFRIFQETLTNIVRHASATQVTIHLKKEADKLILEVQDNGRGMTGRELSGTRSLGLLGMRERATMLDGEVNIIGRQGKGTTVGVRIPLRPAGEVTKK